MPENPLDNERADVNADGVQCYLGVAGEAVGQWHQAVLCVPLPTGDVRTTVLVPGGAGPRHPASPPEAGAFRGGRGRCRCGTSP